MANPNPSPATRFQAGQTGNPGGRPKGRSVTSRLRELLEQHGLGGDEEAKTNLDLIAERIIAACLNGDHKFIETLLDRTEGKAATRSADDDELEEPQSRDEHGHPVNP